MAAHPHGMDLADLAAYPDFEAYLHDQDAAARRQGASLRAKPPMIEGFAARHAGTGFTENPHEFGTADHGSGKRAGARRWTRRRARTARR